MATTVLNRLGSFQELLTNGVDDVTQEQISGASQWIVSVYARVGITLTSPGMPLCPGFYVEGIDLCTQSKSVTEESCARVSWIDNVDTALWYLPVAGRSYYTDMVCVGHSDVSRVPYDWYLGKKFLALEDGGTLLTNLRYRFDIPFPREKGRGDLLRWLRGDVDFRTVGVTETAVPVSVQYIAPDPHLHSFGVGVFFLDMAATFRSLGPRCGLFMYSGAAVLPVGERSYLFSGVAASPNEGRYTRGAAWYALKTDVPEWFSSYCLSYAGLLPIPTVEPPGYYKSLRVRVDNDFDIGG